MKQRSLMIRIFDWVFGFETKTETKEAKTPIYTHAWVKETDNIEYLLDMVDSIKNGEVVANYLVWDELIQRIEAVANNETVTKATMERFGIGRKN